MSAWKFRRPLSDTRAYLARLRTDIKAPVLDVAAFSCPQPDGLFTYPGDVTKYVQCSNNVPTVHRCPDGHWNHDR
ncbi:chitin binding peritrophin-A domain-containing protein [Nocardia abscessus]|uniref:chitin binding peritrophin-A domain-containing protein n=1 Tax=Nocardia abscessus TaxID=120957 RepID=UPI0039814AE6